MPNSRILGVLAIATLACSRPATQPPDEALREADVGLAQAIAAARDHVPNGAVFDADFEVGRRGPVYEVELLDGEEVYEVYVDSEDGRVIAHEIQVGDDELAEARAAFAYLQAAEVSFAEAIAAAERELEGIAVEAEITKQGYVVAVLTDRGGYRAVVDSRDGSIVSTAAAEAEPEADPDDPADDDDDSY